jgi:hypothetical protein
MDKQNQPKRKNRNKNRRRNRQVTNAGMTNVPMAVNNRRTPRQRRRGALKIETNGAKTTVRMCEVFPPLVAGINNMVIQPGRSKLVKLDQFGQQYDHYAFKRIVARYRTSSGTTSTGHVYMGADYSSADLPTDMTGAAALWPRVEGPVWENLDLNLDVQLAMTKKIMACGSTDPDNVAAVLSLYTDVAASGVVSLEYDVEFSSPTKGTTPSAGGGGVVLGSSSSVTAVANQVLEVIGEPSTEAAAGISTKATVTPVGQKIETDFTPPSAGVGDQFVINSVAPLSSSLHSNGSNVVVTFKDAASGQVLPSSVVKNINTIQRTANGIFSSIWQFVKPFAKPFIISCVETLLGAANGPLLVTETAHVLTTDVPTSIEVTVPVQVIGDLCHSNWEYASGAYNLKNQVNGYFINTSGGQSLSSNVGAIPRGTSMIVSGSVSGSTGFTGVFTTYGNDTWKLISGGTSGSTSFYGIYTASLQQPGGNGGTTLLDGFAPSGGIGSGNLMTLSACVIGNATSTTIGV